MTDMGPGATSGERREPSWFYWWMAVFMLWMAYWAAWNLQSGGFDWWLAAGIVFFGINAGVWIAQTPPVSRLMAWRRQKYGTDRGTPTRVGDR